MKQKIITVLFFAFSSFFILTEAQNNFLRRELKKKNETDILDAICETLEVDEMNDR